MLLDKLKQDQLSERKLAINTPVPHKTRATLLTTLIGEASSVGKNDGNRESSDEEVIAIIKKFIKNIDEVIVNSIGTNLQAQMEKQILMAYLPKQLSEAELEDYVRKTVHGLNVTSMKDMGLVMKDLKAHRDGEYDGKMASQVVKKVLSEL